MTQTPSIESIVSLAKRRGFVYPSSDIYGGFAAVYDYGPYGTELANNIKAVWWKAMVQRCPNIVGLDSGIAMHPKIWEASGHVAGFADPLVESKITHERFRVDHLLEDIGVVADEKMNEQQIDALFKQHLPQLQELHPALKDVTDVKRFNLLVQTNLGNFTGNNKHPVYLRGETCQGIYVNYKNVLDSCRVKIPFGIAQIGKAFRNEITARQFIFRTREFEQMELQYFVHPDLEMQEYENLRAIRWQYYIDLGIHPDKLRWAKHENLVFYAKEAYDIEYEFPFGWKELEGVHARGNYDLTQHAKFSGQKLDYRDPESGNVYVPHIVESSVGVGRTMLMVLSDAYAEEQVADGDVRTVLRFPKALSPIKVAVFPLLKNKPELVKKAMEVFGPLTEHWMCEFDSSGNIGKRYRRQDEIGTPYCVTVDFDTLDNNTVTVRDRDTMQQTRMPIAQLEGFFSQQF